MKSENFTNIYACVVESADTRDLKFLAERN